MTEAVERLGENSIRIDQLKPLVHYFKALVHSYPSPITQKELASKINKTKSAVNKVKDRIFGFCDETVLAYRSKMVLSKDIGTFLKLIMLFVYTDGGYSVRELLESNYGKKMIHNLYGSLSTSEGMKQLEDFLNENEFQQLIEIISPTLGCIEPLDMLISTFDDLDEEFVLQAALFNILKQTENKFKIRVRDEADNRFLKNLRARFSKILIEFLKNNIEKMEIITNLRSDEEQKVYQDVYSKTIDHYLPKILDMSAKIAIEYVKLPHDGDIS